MAGIDQLNEYAPVTDLTDCVEFFNVSIKEAPFIADFYLTLTKISRSKVNHITRKFYDIKKKIEGK